MDIQFNPQVDTIAKVAPGQVKPRGPAPTDEVVLTESAALDTQLSAAPDVRADQVRRGRELVADPHYPPAETISKIAQLLAIHIEPAE